MPDGMQTIKRRLLFTDVREEDTLAYCKGKVNIDSAAIKHPITSKMD
jgi:hypothetical protein